MIAVLRKVASFPVLLGTILVGSVVLATQSKLPDPDMLLHISVGEQILTTRTFPTSDTFSFTVQGRPSLAYEWLGQVLIAAAARWRGYQGLMILLVALGAGLVLLLYYYASLRSGNPKAAFLACLALWPLIVLLFALRPQILGYGFLLITLICLERFRQGRRGALWFLPAVFVLWVNTHGSFLFGLFALGVYWASGLVDFRWGNLQAKRWTPQERLRLEAVALLCVAALTVTPYGTRLAAFPLELVRNSPLGIAVINEYQPVMAYHGVLLIFIIPLLAFTVAQIIWRPRYYAAELIIFLTATYLAWVHLRFLYFFMLMFPPLLAALLAAWVPRYEAGKDRPALNVVIMLLVSLGVVRLFPSATDLATDFARTFPTQAVEYLRQHPVKEPMFNLDGTGDYLIYARYPAHKVFIDTRSQLYEEAGVYADFVHMMAVDPETPSLLRKYRLESCLIARGEALATYLAAQPDWQQVYADNLSVLFVHAGADPNLASAGNSEAGQPPVSQGRRPSRVSAGASSPRPSTKGDDK